jgi:hypothetical protein
MYQYRLWVRINDLQTAHTVVWADNDYAAKQLGESQYGAGNVLGYTNITPQVNG